MPTELRHDTIFLLGVIVTLANIVERVKFHHQMVHEVAWPLGNGEAVMSCVDVHEIPHHEELVLVIVMVPTEFALHFHHLTSWPFNAAIVFGRQCSSNNENFSSKLILFISAIS